MVHGGSCRCSDEVKARGSPTVCRAISVRTRWQTTASGRSSTAWVRRARTHEVGGTQGKSKGGSRHEGRFVSRDWSARTGEERVRGCEGQGWRVAVRLKRRARHLVCWTRLAANGRRLSQFHDSSPEPTRRRRESREQRATSQSPAARQPAQRPAARAAINATGKPQLMAQQASVVCRGGRRPVCRRGWQLSAWRTGQRRTHPCTATLTMPCFGAGAGAGRRSLPLPLPLPLPSSPPPADPPTPASPFLRRPASPACLLLAPCSPHPPAHPPIRPPSNAVATARPSRLSAGRRDPNPQERWLSSRNPHAWSARL